MMFNRGGDLILLTCTLDDNRVALQLAELEREGGFGPRVSPMASKH